MKVTFLFYTFLFAFCLYVLPFYELTNSLNDRYQKIARIGRPLSASLKIYTGKYIDNNFKDFS